MPVPWCTFDVPLPETLPLASRTAAHLAGHRTPNDSRERNGNRHRYDESCPGRGDRHQGILYGSLRVGTAGSVLAAISCASNEHVRDVSSRQSGIGESDFVVHRRVASDLVQAGNKEALEYWVSVANGSSGVGILIPGERSGRSRQRLSGGFAAKS
jgi:hypothetical protein